MSTEPKKNLGKDQKTFDELPARIRKTIRLGDEAEIEKWDVGRDQEAGRIRQTMTEADTTIHRPRIISYTRRLRIASLLLLGNRLLIVTASGMLLVSVFANDRHLLVHGTILVGISVVLIFAQWFAASQVGCPLCRTPVLAPMGCVKHRKARRLLGCYRLRVACAIIFKERFRCPYCNKHTAMESKERLRGTRLRSPVLHR
jgi:hypothetical protein